MDSPEPSNFIGGLVAWLLVGGGILAVVVARVVDGVAQAGRKR